MQDLQALFNAQHKGAGDDAWQQVNKKCGQWHAGNIPPAAICQMLPVSCYLSNGACHVRG